MIVRRSADPQFDLFVPYVADLPLRDQRETMERPFFSLAKRKRQKPIEYTSPNGEVFVNVFPNQEFGMATIWDADILIWAASVMNDRRKRGENDLPRTLSFHPYDLLKTIGRETGGRQYQLLREALGRLQSTTIVTNIRVKRGKKQRQFSWIESWTDLVDEEGKQSRGMTLTLSDWFYEGLLMDGGLLSIDPVYFSITGGRERWLYRVARKHAGGAGEGGFAIPLPTLFEKSGAEGTYRRFKFEVLAIVRRNDIPGFDLALELGRGEPVLRMTRAGAEGEAAAKPTAQSSSDPARATTGKPHASLPLFGRHALSDKTISRIRNDFPGWDVYGLQAEFDAWVDEAAGRVPRDYDAAFYGFVRQHHARHRG
jgi:plasmid replication initiation protein